MDKYFIIYNPLAGAGEGQTVADSLEKVLDKVVGKADITKITNYKAFMEDKEDYIFVVCGGDGTLNRFINDIEGIQFTNRVFYRAVGTGNDFLRDIECMDVETPVEITQYIHNLPVCEVNGRKYRFINGVGYGIDGYCSEEGDRLRKQSDKKVNYTNIAIGGLLGKYKPTGATVTVDGKVYRFEKVWLAPSMFGRFYGGGIMPTPKQDRKASDQKLSVFLFHGSGKLRTLTIFPKIFTGDHLQYTKYTTVIEGNEITVEFDEARSLQVDGETVLNVKKYTAHVYNQEEVLL